MPEYLAPGVYVEEIDTGSKPIEGVSTSTAGMIGVAERGPVNIPILITSYGEYTRWFGERLNIEEFTSPIGPVCYLPQAVEGFFTNGGKRVYVTRILDIDGAVRASFNLHDRGTVDSAATWLLRPAGELTGTAANQPSIYVLDISGAVPNSGTLDPDDRIRIGDGSNSEYRDVEANPIGVPTHVALSFATSRTHALGATIEHILTVPVGGAFTLDADAPRNDELITITGAAADIVALAEGNLLEIGDHFLGELRFVTSVTLTDATHAQVGLDSPIAGSYLTGAVVTRMDETQAVVVDGNQTLGVDAAAGDRVVFVVDRGTAFTDRNDIVIFERADPAVREARRIGELVLLTLSTGAYGNYAGGSVIENVTLVDDVRELAVFVDANHITLDDVSLIGAGETLAVGDGVNLENVTVTAVDTVTNTVTLGGAGLTLPGHVAGEPVIPGFMQKTLTGPSRAGAAVIAVNNRVGLAEGDVLRIGDAPEDEYVTVESVPNQAEPGISPDAGNVVLAHALNRDHETDTPVRRQDPPVVNTLTPVSVVALSVDDEATLAAATDGDGYAGGDFIRVTTASGQVSYHRLEDVDAVDPRPINLMEALAAAHEAGSPVAERNELILVEAIDAGAWGDRLRLSVADEGSGLVKRTTLRTIIDATHIRLGSASGVEPGTVLELLDPLNDDAVVGDPLKVVSIDRASNFTITLAGTGLSADQQTAEANAGAAGTHLIVRSREFSLTVYLLRQPDPAMPSRNNQIIASEVFRNLSMDPRHSRYIQRIIGDINGELRLSDRRPEGESWYIRVHDLAQDLLEPDRTDTLESIRLGPEALVDVLPDGRRRPARHALEGGDDSMATLSEDIVVGTDDPDPLNRTGLQTLRNEDEISIIAAPGQTSPVIQGALIDQCENMRYRFAVLDGPIPPADSLNDVQEQRQQFDTKYAALYHPWLLVRDPFPDNLSQVANFPLPPSGHTIGIYARTDIERGVHKAPANEVVRGIIGLQRSLNKGEQDILNPYPVNINVIRDFRPDNRGIRVWGGRVITSDPDWKYVNVRRLLIFIEKSLDRGLQWVVFEPNAEPLWARVKRTISNFLTVVWRNGALEGTKPEEAYFVKCDRTTMTQTDIDNGRLICVIGVAPVKPAEFVIIRIGLWTAHADN